MKLTFNPKHSFLIFSLLVAGTTCMAQKYQPALSISESLKALKVEKGFKVQLYASEPYVANPTCLEFDEKGNAYVVELYDYPFEVKPGEGKSRIRFLQDTNGDGLIDKSTIFAADITVATSILPWKGGLIVTAAPNIMYLKDTNGDGKADVKEVLFSGFFQANTEAQITSLRLGVDNWIYANNRGQAGVITYHRKPGDKPMQVAGADFRFRLDRNQFEMETGPGQFGQTLDDYGHRFFSENSIHVQQSVIAWRYSHRHPYLPSSKFVFVISDHDEIMYQKTKPPYWRAERTKQRNKFNQESHNGRTEYAEGHFTGACGSFIYNGDSFAKEFYGNLFTCDVAGSLVHRDVLTQNGNSPILKAVRGAPAKDTEFLYTADDTWFHPVNFTVGPDGYMYVLDYHRQHIETPVSIPDDLKADMDFMAGSDMGRIYRVMPEDAQLKIVNVNLKSTPSLKLIPLLEHPNGWYRAQAHRLLLERNEKALAPAVKAFFNKTQDPRARVLALYVLEGTHSLDAITIAKALQDNTSGVRENALMLAEGFPTTLPQVLPLANDSSPQVVLQAALSIGNFAGPKVVPALAEILEKNGEDKLYRVAVLSSNLGSSTEMLNTLNKNAFFKSETAWKVSFVEEFSHVIGARNNKLQVSAFLNLISNAGSAYQTAAVKGLKTGLAKAQNPSAQLTDAAKAMKSDSPADVKEALTNLKKLY
jgi:putative membrane-bound dehydrogenase-like protein